VLARGHLLDFCYAVSYVPAGRADPAHVLLCGGLHGARGRGGRGRPAVRDRLAAAKPAPL